MAKKRIKISELTPANSLAGFSTLGYKVIDGKKTSVRLDLSYVQTAYQNTIDATGKANEAAGKANKAAADANTKMTQISQDVSQAIRDTNTAKDNANTAAGNANDEAANLEELKKAVTNASYLAEDKAGEAEKQAKEAGVQAAEAKKQAAYAKEEGDKAAELNNRVIELEDTKLDGLIVENDLLYGLVNGELYGEGISMPSGGGGGVIGMQYFLRTMNNLESKSLFASKGQPCYINFTFVSQQREGSDQPYTDTGERGYCQIFARAGREPYREVKSMYVESGKAIQFDVAPYLASGDNNIKINIAGEDTAVNAPALTYSVQLTALSLSANNFQWWQAFQSAVLIPLNIGGNISKTLHIDVSGADYNQSYTVELGTNIYTETSYNYSLLHPGKTGVFNVSFYVSNVDGTIRTNVVSFNIICILSGATQKLLAINNRISKAVNWSENKMFDYALYDAGKVSTSAKFTVLKDGVQIYDSENDAITTSAKQTFTLPLELETVDNTDFDVVVKVTDAVSEMLSMTIPVDNSLGFSANAGAVFYLNPRTRTNSQANRQSVVNEMDGDQISATWKNFNWGADGWMTDAEGNKVLRVMAGSSVDIAYKPFAVESARTGKTIEIDYKVDNVTDFDKESLTIASASASFVGIKLFPDNLIVHSQSLKNDDFHSLNLRDGQRIRMSLTIMPDAYGNAGFNICAVYINGRKNRVFTYENNDYFANASNIVIGSDYADIDLYGIRVYDFSLTSTGVLRNYINWLANREDKIRETDRNNVLDANGSEIAYENVKKQFNVFVFNNTFPRLSNPNKFTGQLEFYFAVNPELNKVIPVAEASGQGTTSSRYWLWNIKFKLKNILWAMILGIPEASVLTAKKNFASSMQSHKMGSVNSFDDLFKAMGLTNEAMEENSEVRVAVYQEPFVGFEKTVNDEGVEIYTFMGLYTAGPDKGDKNTFGYDTTKFPGLISIEGSDNAPLPALFRVPWNVSAGRIVYNPDEEAFQYNGVNSFDFDGGKESNISKFIPAYNLVYECSPRLKCFNGTIDELNAQVLTYRNEPCEFWLSGSFDVYYYEASVNKFIPSDTGDGPINLVTQLVGKGYGLESADLNGQTDDVKNELFIKARIQKFRQEAAQYWDIDDAIYHRNWVEFHAATDNRAKNTYPYTFGTATSKWKWRGDDFDTIFDIDNQGQAKKSYSVEFHDLYANGAPVWNGETSNFWNLIDLSFPEEVVSGMRKMMSVMEELGGLANGDDFDKLFAYFRKYYWSKAQEYFSANLYNADAKFTYEMAKLAYKDGLYTNDTDPMTQALGDHYSAEQRWVMKRIVYMMSKYSFGMFSANGTDSISVRAAGNSIKYELTPAMDLYPAIASGTSIIRGDRTKAGETCEMIIDLAGSGDQQNTIMGASYLQDIGEWHDKNVTGAMIIQGKRLRRIRLGSKTEPITISISSLTISNCVSLQVLSLSRIATLSGLLNLSACTHLKEVYADGTALSQIVLPAGGGLQHIEYSAYNRYINLQNFPLLQSSGVVIDYCKEIITDLLVSGCDKLNPIDTLTTIIEAQKSQAEHALKRIRCIGFDANCPESTIDMLLGLADGTYVGLDANGVETAGLPVLDGKIHVPTIREDKLAELGELFPELVITYDTLTLLPAVTLSFASSLAKPLLVTKLECSSYSQKIDNTTFKVKGLLNSKFAFTFSALNHEDVTGEVTITQQEDAKEYSATYIPLRTIRVLKRNTTIFIPNAVVKIGDETYTANSAGQVQIRKKMSVAGTVEANDYNDSEFSFDAITDDAFNTVYLDPCAVVTFTVRDDKNNLLSGAVVSVGGKQATTDSSGNCKITLKKGDYSYSVKYQSYAAKGNTTVGLSNMSVSVVVTLDITTMIPEENGNIQMMLTSTAAVLNITSTNANYVIDWGDGEKTQATGTGAQNYNHTYSVDAYYQVEISNCEEITSCNGTAECLAAYWSIGDSLVKNLLFRSFTKLLYVGLVFKNDVTRASFANCLSGCISLISYAEGIFDNCVYALYFGGTNREEHGCFCECSALESVHPNTFSKCIQVKSFGGSYDRNGCFFNCSKLKSIPDELFYENINVESFERCFYLAGLENISAQLFKNNTKAKVFEYCFYRTHLKEIPAGLLENVMDGAKIDGMFAFLRNFESQIPAYWDLYADKNFITKSIFVGLDDASNWNEVPTEWGGPLLKNKTFILYIFNNSQWVLNQDVRISGKQLFQQSDGTYMANIDILAGNHDVTIGDLTNTITIYTYSNGVYFIEIGDTTGLYKNLRLDFSEGINEDIIIENEDSAWSYDAEKGGMVCRKSGNDLSLKLYDKVPYSNSETITITYDNYGYSVGFSDYTSSSISLTGIEGSDLTRTGQVYSGNIRVLTNGNYYGGTSDDKYVCLKKVEGIYYCLPDLPADFVPQAPASMRLRLKDPVYISVPQDDWEQLLRRVSNLEKEVGENN